LTFSLAAILLPLLPLAMLLLRKSPHQHRVLPLITLCIIAFFKQALLMAIAAKPDNEVFINAIFNIAELTVLFLYYRAERSSRKFNHALNLVLMAVLSVIATVYVLEGVRVQSARVEVFESVFIMLISLIAIINVMGREEIFFLQSPVFWIAGGSFCYHAIFLLCAGIRHYVPLSGDTQTERFILLAAVGMLRYVFYIIAAWVSPESQEEPFHYQPTRRREREGDLV